MGHPECTWGILRLRILELLYPLQWPCSSRQSPAKVSSVLFPAGMEERRPVFSRALPQLCPSQQPAPVATTIA